MNVSIKRIGKSFYIHRGSSTVTDEERDEWYRRHVEAVSKQIAHDVPNDIQHHFDKHGTQRVDGCGWIAIITEEFGEAVQAYLQRNWVEAAKEINQTIACLMRLAAEAEREEAGLNITEQARYSRPT